MGDLKLRVFILDGRLKLPPWEVLHLLSFSILFLINPYMETNQGKQNLSGSDGPNAQNYYVKYEISGSRIEKTFNLTYTIIWQVQSELGKPGKIKNPFIIALRFYSL